MFFLKMHFQSLFSSFHSALKSQGLIADVSARFGECKNDCDRVTLVSELNQFQDVFCHENSVKSKDVARAAELKELGNSYYRKKELIRALETYTNGIFNIDFQKCETASSVASLLYANRSAVLYHLREYRLCCRDVEEAIKHGYPAKLLSKLYERSGKCYYNIGDFERAKESFNKSLLALSSANLEKDDKNNQARELFKQIQACQRDSKSQASVAGGGKPKLPVIATEERNKIFVSATKHFELKFSEEKGRFGVAAADIYPGDIIIVDKPFAKVLLPKYLYNHCFHCMIRCQALLPCRKCPYVGFCSHECEQACWEQYHHYDCVIYGQVLQGDLGLGYLALRTVLVAGLSTVLRCMDSDSSLSTDPLSIGLNSEGLYDPLSYASIHSLVGNCDKRSIADLFSRAVKASYLLFLLKKTTFFPVDVSSEQCYKVGGNLMKQLQMLPCNAHEISELKYNGSFTQAESVEIGSAIYATLSLLNHSCDPSVVRHSYGGDCVLRAIKVIKKGEDIVDNYGTLYAVSREEERQQLLQSQYFFRCSCAPCVFKWPLYDELPKDRPMFKCQNCGSGTTTLSNGLSYRFCKHCNVDRDFTIEIEEYVLARNAFLQGKESVFKNELVGSQLPSLLNFLCVVCKYVVLPWQEFNDCQEIVKQCLSMLGNCYLSRDC